MGKLFLVLLLLIVGLGVAGFANYQRNEALDHELQNRPYQAYELGDLENETDLGTEGTGTDRGRQRVVPLSQAREQLAHTGKDPDTLSNEIPEHPFLLTHERHHGRVVSVPAVVTEHRMESVAIVEPQIASEIDGLRELDAVGCQGVAETRHVEPLVVGNDAVEIEYDRTQTHETDSRDAT